MDTESTKSSRILQQPTVGKNKPRRPSRKTSTPNKIQTKHRLWPTWIIQIEPPNMQELRRVITKLKKKKSIRTRQHNRRNHQRTRRSKSRTIIRITTGMVARWNHWSGGPSSWSSIDIQEGRHKQIRKLQTNLFTKYHIQAICSNPTHQDFRHIRQTSSENT